jgi:hypothetical protein
MPCHSSGDSDQIGEWLASPYSEMEGGRGCVQCHDRLCLGNGDRRRGVNLEDLREAVRLGVTASRSGDAVSVEVAVTNVGVGHLLPTGPGARSLVLDVAAHERDGNTILWRGGSRDLQLPPFATALNRYRFVSMREGPVRVSARLVLVPGDADPLEIAEAAATCSPGGE